MNTVKRPLTGTLIGLITAVYIVGNGINFFGTQLLNPVFPNLFQYLELFRDATYTNGGALHGVANGEWWRLITVALTHASLIHLASNMFCLWSVGPAVERFFGEMRAAIIFIVSLLCGSLFSVFTAAPNQVSVGASGAIFGLFGALFVFMRKARMNYQSIVSTIVLNLVITFSIPGIDWHAHIGGLVGGAASAYLLMFSKRT